MACDNRSPVSQPMPDGWRMQIDQRRAAPGEHPARGFDASYTADGGRVTVTGFLAPDESVVVRIRQLLEKARAVLGTGGKL